MEASVLKLKQEFHDFYRGTVPHNNTKSIIKHRLRLLDYAKKIYSLDSKDSYAIEVGFDSICYLVLQDRKYAALEKDFFKIWSPIVESLNDEDYNEEFHTVIKAYMYVAQFNNIHEAQKLVSKIMEMGFYAEQIYLPIIADTCNLIYSKTRNAEDKTPLKKIRDYYLRGLYYFFAALYDIHDKAGVKKVAAYYKNALKLDGIDSISELTKAFVYSKVGRDVTGEPLESKVYANSELSQKVEDAIEIIWWYEEDGRAQEALKLLREAAAEGDPNAYYFLGRTYFGECFVLEEMKYEENDEKALENFNLSLEKGSPYGMLAAHRIEGMEMVNGTFAKAPYKDDFEVFEAMYKNHLNGEVFASYIVANAFYYKDICNVLNLEYNSVIGYYSSKIALKMYLAQMKVREFDCGYGNALDIVTSGEDDFKPSRKLKRKIDWLYWH